jgi:hypothetical protein
MTSAKSHSPRCPYLPDPWDDPEDHVDVQYWLEAFQEEKSGVLGQYLRHFAEPDRRVLLALAGKIDPPTSKAIRYVWKRSHGRPRHVERVDDPVQTALDGGDLPVVAKNLRTPSNPDPRVIAWLADQLDPEPGGSHFEIKLPRGRRPRHPKSVLPFTNNNTRTMRLGAKIGRLYRQYGKLEAALEEVMAEAKEAGNKLSRSSACRAYVQHMNRRAMKNPLI